METVNLLVPTCWQELTPLQLRYAFFLLVEGYSPAQLKTLALARWSGLKVIAPQQGGFTVLHYGRTFFITALQLAELLSRLDWLCRIPLVPVRLPEIHGHQAAPADFTGVSFETYLYLENLYQGVIHLSCPKDGPLTPDTMPLLSEMTDMLYNCSACKYDKSELLSMFYWFASLKQFFARKFPHLFATTDAGSMSADLSKQLTEAMNTQIRALTKGDITKEQQVLQMDVHRALTELDAQAREYEELKKHAKS